MRRDLVGAVLDAASALLFEDVVWTHGNGAPVTVAGAIAGAVIASERFDTMGERSREVTHTVRALKAKLPGIAKGDILNDGTAYSVLDIEPIGDGRLEILISLKRL